MAKVKVRRPSPAPAPAPPPVPEFAWGDKSVVIPKTAPSPACSFPGCRRKGLILPPVIADPLLKRVSRWCIWHKPNQAGERPINTADPPLRHNQYFSEAIGSVPSRIMTSHPDIPRCMMPGCPRGREIKIRPFDLETNTYLSPIRWPVCYRHRRTHGVHAWRDLQPESVVDQFDAEDKERRIRESAIRREWKRARLMAKHHMTVDPAGAPRVKLSAADGWTPMDFWNGSHPADKTHILRVWESSVLKQRQPVEVKLAELHDRWQNYAFPPNGTPVVPYAPNPAQWQELFEWMTEQASTEEGHDRLRSQSAQEMK